ncbi:MAG: hypothetical protein RQ982_02065 [Gammaproteobacteria bacterium]|nr:hypothetical protein [Gammaproteobacteria bacterium]
MLSGVEIWWLTLSVVSLANIAALLYSALVFVRRKACIAPDTYHWRRLMLWLSGGYVIGCAFRSFLPRIDLERVCLLDSWLSSMLVGRSVATVAELCFIAQCAILLREAGSSVEDRFAVTASRALIPMIIIAEGFSWYAIASTNYVASVVEESIWTMAGIMLTASFISLWPRFTGIQRHFFSSMIVFGVGFIVFMVAVDVPMYWTRWQQDAALGLDYLPFITGIQDTSRDCTVSFQWQDWQQEIPWMTLYFTVAVWVSIYLPHAPAFSFSRSIRRHKTVTSYR